MMMMMILMMIIMLMMMVVVVVVNAIVVVVFVLIIVIVVVVVVIVGVHGVCDPSQPVRVAEPPRGVTLPPVVPWVLMLVSVPCCSTLMLEWCWLTPGPIGEEEVLWSLSVGCEGNPSWMCVNELLWDFH